MISETCVVQRGQMFCDCGPAGLPAEFARRQLIIANVPEGVIRWVFSKADWGLLQAT